MHAHVSLTLWHRPPPNERHLACAHYPSGGDQRKSGTAVAVRPDNLRAQRRRGVLRPSSHSYASLIASWVYSVEEAYWLAPKTPAPLTEAHVRAWRKPGHEPLALFNGREAQPIAYGELNVLSAARGEYWLGHLIVAPQHRGNGWGRCLTELLLERAYRRHAARRVSLVVFPENERAIGCYHRAGFREEGYEEHELRHYGRLVRLLRMSATNLA